MRSWLSRRSPAALLAIATLAAVPSAVPVVEAAQRPAAKSRLQAFDSCTDLVRYARRRASRVEPVAVGRPAPAPAPQRGEADGSAPTAAPDYSETNVQEQGVDEPDTVKTDGSRIFAVAGGKLHAVAPGTDGPRLLGSLSFPEGFAQELLLDGNRALVLSQGAGIYPADGPRAASLFPGYPSRTTLSEVDVSDPTAMRVVRTLEVDGSYVTARLRKGSARFVFRSSPRAFEQPQPEPRPATGVQSARRARRPRTSDWVPSAVLRDRRSGRVSRRSAVRCREVRHPPEFSGLDMVTVLTVDMDRGLPGVDSDAVMAGADTVYASQRSLYVATQRWLESSEALTTSIHQLDVSDPGNTDYLASGEVRGHLLSQFSMSEHGGVLRVASTDARRVSESFVTVLDRKGPLLTQVGKVGDIGKDERIFGVRFIGDRGYVVTFRQTDPLYTLDLSRPADPRVVGELKLLGYSAYLHPVGDHLLLGVGQDASEQGRTLGTQLSLFDVEDPAKPVRLQQRTIAQGSSSQVEYDHRAFLWWAPTRLAVLPVQVYGGDPGPVEGEASSSPPSDQFVGAIGFGVERSGISEAGRVEHRTGQGSSAITRSLVVGGRLYTLSEAGMHATTIDGFAPAGSVEFPAP